MNIDSKYQVFTERLGTCYLLLLVKQGKREKTNKGKDLLTLHKTLLFSLVFFPLRA